MFDLGVTEVGVAYKLRPSTTRMPGDSRSSSYGRWTGSTATGAEGALRLIRQFKHCGCIPVSVKKSWLNAAPEVQDVLVAFAGWTAQQESRRRSERIKARLDRHRAQGKPVGRQPRAADKKPRKRSGYVVSWENGRRRTAHQARAVSRRCSIHWRIGTLGRTCWAAARCRTQSSNDFGSRTDVVRSACSRDAVDRQYGPGRGETPRCGEQPQCCTTWTR